MENQVNDYLKKKDYAALDQLYANASQETFVIYQTSGLHYFFEAIPPSRNESEDRWKDRLSQLKAWQTADADSEAVALAIADYYVEYGFKARGTGWAREVSSDGWKQFSERLKLASSILDAPDKSAGNALYGHYLRAWINAPGEDTFATTRKEIAYLNKTAPHFHEAYMLMANYLLPRWSGRPGELTGYATQAGNYLGGEDGDILYADMMTYAAFIEGDNFASLHHPDVDRLKRGCEALIHHETPNDRYYGRQRYAYAMAMLGDWATVRKQLLLLGPIWANDSYYDYYWSGRKGYENILTKCGIRNDLVSAQLLEGRNQLAEAESVYNALLPDDTAANRWLSDFYLRQGEEAKYASSAGAVDLKIPADKISLNDVCDRCIIFGTLRDFKQGEPFAKRFDQTRGHNFSGKTFFYEAALFGNDTEAAQKARDAIINRKTNRKSYQVAQRALSDDAYLMKFNPNNFDWDDEYSRQGAIIVALRLYEMEDPQSAQKLLQAALDASTYHLDSEHIRSLMFHPPSKLETHQ